MSTTVQSKITVSVVSTEFPLEKCPIGTHLFIKKDNRNNYDEKAMSVLVKHKTNRTWTFIGFVAAKKDYIVENGISNSELYDLLDPIKLAANGKVIDHKHIVYPYGQEATALVVEVDPLK
jgi:hypothetical protein